MTQPPVGSLYLSYSFLFNETLQYYTILLLLLICKKLISLCIISFLLNRKMIWPNLLTQDQLSRNSGNLPRIFIMLVAELTPYVISETLIEDEIRGQNLYCQPVSLFPNNKSCSRHKLFQNFGFDECEVW